MGQLQATEAVGRTGPDRNKTHIITIINYFFGWQVSGKARCLVVGRRG
jgi:hypothetical protein